MKINWKIVNWKSVLVHALMIPALGFFFYLYQPWDLEEFILVTATFEFFLVVVPVAKILIVENGTRNH